VKVIQTGVCRSQLMELIGGRASHHWAPHLLGHEAVGTVVENGAGVTKVNKYDRVVCSWLKGSGIDGGGVQYLSKNGLTVNAGPIATFCEYAVISENRLYRLGESISDEVATMLGCAIPTGAGMVLKSRVRNTDSVAVIGLGGIGMSCLIALRALGVSDVHCLEADTGKRRFATNLGAKVYSNIEDIARSHSGGFDFCFEAGGSAKTIELAFELTRIAGGNCIFASHPPVGENICLDPHALISGKSIKGSWGGGVDLDQDLASFADLFNSFSARLSTLVKYYDLADVNQALRDLATGSVFRPMIRL
jgi:S-(hydroxymethyl)glutathione dehydrogenase/alcohol dehydrogenase